ncbi:MAG: SDR family oxidoreductase [Deltaproteobacteria bacterium]|nr:SDR family oxidoreductase [Deltaproteobacteria bacterium]
MAGFEQYFLGKHVIITGGSSGIGLATARRLASMGASVTLIARREGLLEEARGEVQAAALPGMDVHTLALDVSSESDIQAKLLPHIEAHPANVLINNAGVSMPGRFLEQDPEYFRRLMDINYFGAVNMARAVVPHLIAQGGGHLANVGSLLSVMAIYGYSAYAASKFALYGFSESLRAELAPLGVRVTILLPPDTDTPQHTAELEHLPEETRALAGSVKMLAPDDVADALLRGMARGRFEIIPGLEGRATVLANRWMPGIVRSVCDGIQRRAMKGRSAPDVGPQGTAAAGSGSTRD